MTKKLNKIAWTPIFFDFDTESDEDEDEEFIDDDDVEREHDESLTFKLPKILITPLGPFKLDDTLNPLRHFEFWMGSTNFNITQKVFNTLEKIDGIEKLKLVGRYTFIIGVGKMFDFHDVRLDIENQLCTNITPMVNIDNSYKDILLNKYEKLAKNKYWALIILPNGKTDEITSDSLSDDFVTTLNLFKESRDNCNSVLFCSHKELVDNGSAP